MISQVYRLIVLIVLIYTVWNLYEETDLKKQAMTAMVIIPLVLRVLLIK